LSWVGSAILVDSVEEIEPTDNSDKYIDRKHNASLSCSKVLMSMLLKRF